jgi:tripeptide aminopeptidase
MNHRDQTPILDSLPGIAEQLRTCRELLLANAVMLGEIPAPTFSEQARMQFVMNRFAEAGLQNSSIDEKDNATGILPGTEGERNILVVAHADTVHDATESHTMQVSTERVTGLGIADNSMGLAAVISLPHLLEHLGIQFRSNLILQASSQTLGRGNGQGLSFFLDQAKLPIHAAICVEGVHLGRLSYSSLGMLRGEIVIRVSPVSGWDEYGGRGAIVVLNELLTKILAIPVAAVPRTSIILGSAQTGYSYNIPPTKAVLRLEVRSEASGEVGRILKQIEAIADEIRAERNVDVRFNLISRRRIGGVSFGHPLVTHCRNVMEQLGIEPKIAPSVGMLSAAADRNIPALTLGLTKGTGLQTDEESVEIEPLFRGIAQLIGVLMGIDEGICDE